MLLHRHLEQQWPIVPKHNINQKSEIRNYRYKHDGDVHTNAINEAHLNSVLRTEEKLAWTSRPPTIRAHPECDEVTADK